MKTENLKNKYFHIFYKEKLFKDPESSSGWQAFILIKDLLGMMQSFPTFLVRTTGLWSLLLFFYSFLLFNYPLMWEFAPVHSKPKMTKSQVRKYIREMEEKREAARQALIEAEKNWELKADNKELEHIDNLLDDVY